MLPVCMMVLRPPAACSDGMHAAAICYTCAQRAAYYPSYCALSSWGSPAPASLPTRLSALSGPAPPSPAYRAIYCNVCLETSKTLAYCSIAWCHGHKHIASFVPRLPYRTGSSLPHPHGQNKDRNPPAPNTLGTRLDPTSPAPNTLPSENCLQHQTKCNEMKF